jgi:hypothetical protein
MGMRSAVKPHLPKSRPLGLFSEAAPEPRAPAPTKGLATAAEDRSLALPGRANDLPSSAPTSPSSPSPARPPAGGLDGLPTPSRTSAASAASVPGSTAFSPQSPSAKPHRHEQPVPPRLRARPQQVLQARLASMAFRYPRAELPPVLRAFWGPVTHDPLSLRRSSGRATACGAGGAANAIEAAIRDAGYAGYRRGHAVARCRSTQVRKQGSGLLQRAAGEAPGAPDGPSPSEPSANALSRTSAEALPFD